MNVVIVRILGYSQSVRPVVLLIIYVVPEILLQRLVLVLCLPICLKVESSAIP